MTRAHLPTGTRPPLLGPSPLTTFVKDRCRGPMWLWENLSPLYCLPFSTAFEGGTTNIEDNALLIFSHPLPFSPSGIIKKEDFLLVANSEILMNLMWLLNPTSIKWTQHFPLNFLLNPRWLFISMAFIKCSIIHPIASFSKPKTKTEPLLCSVIKHQFPLCSPSNLTKKVFLSTKTFNVLTMAQRFQEKRITW